MNIQSCPVYNCNAVFRTKNINSETENSLKTYNSSSVPNPVSHSGAESFGQYFAPVKTDLLIRKNITFSGKIPFLKHIEIPEGYSFNDLLSMAQQEDNKIGQGANSIVYNIPYLSGYVLKILNKDDPNKIDINEFPQDINLGQPVWQNPENPRMLVLKKINGTEHSIPNWSKTIWDSEIYSPLPVSKEQAKLYLSQIQQLSDMPQSAFDAISRDVKMLDDNGYKVDSINPNNLIVDRDKEEIHIIDYFKVNQNERHIYQNSCMDLMAIMLDFTLFPEFYDKLGEEEKQELLECVDKISEKMHTGAENSGLSCDDEKFKKYIRTTSRWFTAHSVPNGKDGVYFRYYDVRLEDFLKMIENPFEWGKNRTENNITSD